MRGRESTWRENVSVPPAERVRVAREALARVRAAQGEELEAARARVASADAQIALLQENLKDARMCWHPSVVSSRKSSWIAVSLSHLAHLWSSSRIDNAWCNVFEPEPMVPRLRLGQPATVFTDAGGPGISGKVTFVSPRAEFTPRNVQTSDERSKLVYRLKVTVDNRAGVLKPGMPVDAELALQ
jgi:HlyD family secretion protein